MILLTVAQEVHTTLDKFLELQQRETGQPGLFGAIKNVFRKIDFNELCNQAKMLDSYLQGRLDTLNGYYTNNLDEVALKRVLIQYTHALSVAIQKYIVVNTKLAEKAQGKELPWSHYSRLMDDFKAAEQGYLNFGPQLNMCYHKITKR